MFYVYILQSEKTRQYYIGQTNNIEARLLRHNSGFEKFTQKGIPWTLLWKTEKPTRREALLLESKLKNLTRRRLENFINKYASGREP